jgi:hypothetical protein
VTIVRRALLLTIAVFVVLFAATPAMAATTPEACGHACGSKPSVTRAGGDEPTCSADARCAGGASLSAGAGSLLVLGATAGVVLVAIAAIRRSTIRRILPTSRLLSTRLFHPPQFSLSV